MQHYTAFYCTPNRFGRRIARLMNNLLKQKIRCSPCIYHHQSSAVRKLRKSIQQKQRAQYHFKDKEDNMNFLFLRTSLMKELYAQADYLHKNKICCYEQQTIMSIPSNSRDYEIVKFVRRKTIEQQIKAGLKLIEMPNQLEVRQEVSQEARQEKKQEKKCRMQQQYSKQ